MPVTELNQQQKTIYQRDQYAKGGLECWLWDKRDQLALNLLRSFDRTLVDIGCGEGVTLEKMHRLFQDRKVFIIDILSENIEICRRHGCKAAIGDVFDLQLPSHSVNFVSFMEVIEHLEHFETAILEIQKVLVPKGKLVIVFFNDKVTKIVTILTLRFREAAYDPGYVRQWTYHDIRYLLNRQGFTPSFSRNIPFYFWPVSLHFITTAEKNDKNIIH
jgi:2-polyprenyl-3-methyl-5-hydroxy-6-metoxy-1,4-benzoquinol methylase